VLKRKEEAIAHLRSCWGRES